MFLFLLLALCFTRVSSSSCTLCAGPTEVMAPDGSGRRVLSMFGVYYVGVNITSESIVLMTELALTTINANTTLLPDYFLTLNWTEYPCDPSITLAKAVDFMFENSNSMIGSIGGGCSVGTAPVALLSNYYQAPQVAYSSTDPAFSSKTTYPYFMRVVSPDNFQALAWVAVAKHFGWKRVATLNSQEALHAILAAAFLKQAVAEGLEIVVEESFPGSQGYDMTDELQNMANKGATIVFISCYDVDARTILRLKPTTVGWEGDNIVFVGTDAWLVANLLIPQNAEVDTPVRRLNIAAIDQIRQTAQGVIGTTFGAGTSQARTNVYNKFNQTYGYFPIGVKGDFAYDAAYVFAYGLQGLIYKKGVVPPVPITNDWRNQLHGYMLNNTYFQGITDGVITFDQNGDGKMTYAVLNVQNLSFNPVAKWNPISNIWVDQSPIIWPDGTGNVPIDIPIPEEVYLSFGIKWAFIGIAIFCCLIPIINMILLIKYRESEQVKASTPLFLAMILISSLISMSTIFVIAVIPNKVSCVIPHWFNHMAFWIIFSSLFTKTARVYFIFHWATEKLKEPPQMPLWLLLLVVFSTCFLAGVYLAIWTGLNIPSPTATPDPLQPSKVIILQCDYSLSWAGALYAVELAFLSIGVILAYKINQIEVLRTHMLRFNESAHIAIAIYCIIFVGLVIIPNIMWLSEANDTKYILECIGILVINVTLNIVLFFPKWRATLLGIKDSAFSDTIGAEPSPTTSPR